MNLPQKWNPQTWRKIDFYTDFYWNIWHNNKLVSIVENCIILIHTVLYHYRHIISTMIKMFFNRIWMLTWRWYSSSFPADMTKTKWRWKTCSDFKCVFLVVFLLNPRYLMSMCCTHKAGCNQKRFKSHSLLKSNIFNFLKIWSHSNSYINKILVFLN